MIQDIRIDELINKLLTFANFHQIDINNNDNNYNNCVDCIEFKRSTSLI